MSTASLFVSVEAAAALTIAVQAIWRLNKMSNCSASLAWFLLWLATGGAAMYLIGGIMAGEYAPDLHSAAFVLAVATMISMDKRRR